MALVAEKVFVIEAYAVPAIVEYLHVEASLVDNDSMVCVVDEESEPDGAPLDRIGGVVSEGGGGKAPEHPDNRPMHSLPVT